jgi:excisionase family DNA binding protein
MVMERLLLTTTEAAEALGIGRWKLYDLMRKGLLESVLIGGCRRVPSSALSDLVSSMRAVQDDWPS